MTEDRPLTQQDADGHAAKGDRDKAQRSRSRGDFARAALRTSGEDPLAPASIAEALASFVGKANNAETREQITAAFRKHLITVTIPDVGRNPALLNRAMFGDSAAKALPTFRRGQRMKNRTL